MRLRNNPKVLKWVEVSGAPFLLLGLGWLAAGFVAQALIRVVLGWIVILLMASAILGLFAAFSFLPYPYSLMPAAPASLLWPAAVIWSSMSLEKRLQARSDAAA